MINVKIGSVMRAKFNAQVLNFETISPIAYVFNKGTPLPYVKELFDTYEILSGRIYNHMTDLRRGIFCRFMEF